MPRPSKVRHGLRQTRHGLSKARHGRRQTMPSPNNVRHGLRQTRHGLNKRSTGKSKTRLSCLKRRLPAIMPTLRSILWKLPCPNSVLTTCPLRLTYNLPKPTCFILQRLNGDNSIPNGRGIRERNVCGNAVETDINTS